MKFSGDVWFVSFRYKHYLCTYLYCFALCTYLYGLLVICCFVRFCCFVVVLYCFIFVSTIVGLLPPGESPIAVVVVVVVVTATTTTSHENEME